VSSEPADSARYSADEERVLRAAVQAGELPECPRCAVRMTRRAIGGGSFGLGYHRQREWLLCPSCKRSAIFDVRRGTRL
jgi:ribosomal protein L37AE/L43A